MAGYIYAKHPPRGIEYPLSELLEMQTYSIKGDQFNYADTLPHLLFDIPAGTVIVGIGWRIISEFGDTGAFTTPELHFGDTGDCDCYGTLTRAELGSSNNFGFLPIFYESTGASKIDAYFDTGGALDTGAIDIWLMYRPRSESQRWTNHI
jgi:hypothetical protein